MKPDCTSAPPNMEGVDTFRRKFACSGCGKSPFHAPPTPHSLCIYYVFSSFPCSFDVFKCTVGAKSSFSRPIKMIKCDLIETDTLLLLPNKTCTPKKQTAVSNKKKELQWVLPQACKSDFTSAWHHQSQDHRMPILKV